MTASGGTSYAWSNGANTAVTIVTPSVSTTYTVTVTNSNGCTATLSKAINVITAPTVSITKSDDFNCAVSNVTLTANPSTSNVTYAWSGTGGTTAIKTVTAAGNYVVTVTDNVNGCPATANIDVFSNTTPPTVSVTKNSNITCLTTSVTLEAFPSTGATYAWSNGATTQTQTVNTEGSYTVTVTDNANHCTAAGSIYVADNTIVPATLTKSNDLDCNNPTSTLTVNTTSTPVTYAWSDTTATTSSIVVATAKVYNVTVTNTTSGCFIVLTTTVMDTNPRITSVISTNPTLSNCPLLNDGTITVYSTGGDLRYSIDNGSTYQTSNTFYGLVAGNYIIKAKNNTTGCDIPYPANPVGLVAPVCNEPPVVNATPVTVNEDIPTLI